MLKSVKFDFVSGKACSVFHVTVGRTLVDQETGEVVEGPAHTHTFDAWTGEVEDVSNVSPGPKLTDAERALIADAVDALHHVGVTQPKPAPSAIDKVTELVP